MTDLKKFLCNDIAYRKSNANPIDVGIVLKTGQYLIVQDGGSKVKIDLTERKHVKMCWIPGGTSQLVHEDNLKLYDRFLQKDDIVRQIGDNTQLGRCLEVKLVADLCVVNSSNVISNANADELLPFTDFCINDIVMYKEWFGIVKNVEREIFVETRDKSEFILNEEEMLQMERVVKNKKNEHEPSSQCLDFIGQQLCGDIIIFANARRGVLSSEIERVMVCDYAQLLVTIKNINLIAIEVEWIYGFFGMPDMIIEKKDFKKIIKWSDTWRTSIYQGTYCYYRIKENDVIQRLQDWRKHVGENLPLTIDNQVENNAHNTETINLTADNRPQVSLSEPQQNLVEDQRGEKTSENIEYSDSDTDNIEHIEKSVQPGEIVATEIILCRMAANVMWQDGTIENDICSNELIPLDNNIIDEQFVGNFIDENEPTCVKNIYENIKKSYIDKMKVQSTGRPYSVSDTGQVIIDEPNFARDMAHHKKKQRTFICVNWPTSEDELKRSNDTSKHQFNTTIHKADSCTAFFPNIKDSLVFSFKNFVANPVAQFSRMIHQFSYDLSPRSASEIFKLFEISRYCNNFKTLLLKFFQVYEDMFEKDWKMFLANFFIADREKTREICETFCHSSNLNPNLMASNYPEMEDVLNDCDRYSNPDDERTSESKNKQTSKSRKDFCSAQNFPTDSTIDCHKLCIAFDRELHNYYTDSAIASAFLDVLNAQLEKLLSSETKLKEENPCSVFLGNRSQETFKLVSKVSNDHCKNHLSDQTTDFKIIDVAFNDSEDSCVL